MVHEEKLKLVKKYAPILWLHEREAFLPEDCKIIVEISDLYRNSQRERAENQPRYLEDLGSIPRSEECSLNIRDLDMQTFLIPETHQTQITAPGPDAVGHLAREKYGYDFAANGFATNDAKRPKYYARISEATLEEKRGDPFTEYFRAVDPKIFGNYHLIEYFFYFVFNDSWNKHESDWDCLVELFIKDDRKYMVTHFHRRKWASQWPSSSPDLLTWLKSWNHLAKNQLGQAYVLNDHPYVFVAEGSHGGYPTPGFTLHGLDLPKIVARDVMADSDERQIGRLCILPDDVQDELILTNLRFAEIKVNQIRFERWQEPELVENQPWLKYKGLWGEDARFSGWRGPQNPPISRPPNKNSLKEALQKEYESGSVVMNWHGIK